MNITVKTLVDVLHQLTPQQEKRLLRERAINICNLPESWRYGDMATWCQNHPESAQHWTGRALDLLDGITDLARTNDKIKKLAQTMFYLTQTSTPDWQALKDAGYPQDILDFYSFMGIAGEMDVNGVRLLPAAELIRRNTAFYPGMLIQDHGFRVVAATANGDVYAANLESWTIYIVDHEMREETPLSQHATLVALTFREFLEMYMAHQLPQQFYGYF